VNLYSTLTLHQLFHPASLAAHAAAVVATGPPAAESSNHLPFGTPACPTHTPSTLIRHDALDPVPINSTTLPAIATRLGKAYPSPPTPHPHPWVCVCPEGGISLIGPFCFLSRSCCSSLAFRLPSAYLPARCVPPCFVLVSSCSYRVAPILPEARRLEAGERTGNLLKTPVKTRRWRCTGTLRAESRRTTRRQTGCKNSLKYSPAL
jgi:hypothetical protein